MKEWRGLYLPDGEKHLIEWMEQRNETVNGKPTYQYHKLRAAVDLCMPRRTAIDIGAHCGLWSMHLVNEFALVEAFEPMAAHRECFLKNVIADNVELNAVALGDHSGEVSLTTGPASSGDTWLIPAGQRGAVPEAGQSQITRLDDYTERDIRDVDFIKIDCEGYELPVLRGAEETLEKWRPVICVEQKPGHASRFGFGDTEAVGWLLARGYRVAKILSGDYLMVPA